MDKQSRTVAAVQRWWALLLQVVPFPLAEPHLSLSTLSLADVVCISEELCAIHTFGSVDTEYPPSAFSSPQFDGIVGFASEFN